MNHNFRYLSLFTNFNIKSLTFKISINRFSDKIIASLIKYTQKCNTKNGKDKLKVIKGYQQY